MSLDELERQVNPTLTPHQCAEVKLELSAMFSRMSAELTELCVKKARIWLEIRAKEGSDKSADKMWDATEMGVTEMRLRSDIKRSQALMSSLNSMLRVFEHEARNIM